MNNEDKLNELEVLTNKMSDIQSVLNNEKKRRMLNWKILKDIVVALKEGNNIGELWYKKIAINEIAPKAIYYSIGSHITYLYKKMNSIRTKHANIRY